MTSRFDVRQQEQPTTVSTLRPHPTYRENLFTIGFGVWFALGLFLDAWAHNNLAELESFLTPWHAVFYSGFTATAAWISWLVWKNVQAGRRGMDAVPVGYGPAVLALPVFALAGAGDYLWHELFGIEQNLVILFSPTHLLLITSMVLILASPLRAARANPALPAAPTARQLLPAVLSTGFTAALVLLFLQYGNAMALAAPDIIRALTFDRDNSPLFTELLTNYLVVTTPMLVGPLLLLARDWRLPFGTGTVIFTIIGGLCAAITAFGNLSTVAALIAAGFGADLLARWLRPAADRPGAYWAFGGLTALLTWVLYFAVAMAVVGDVPPVVEMWTGMPLVGGLIGLLLAGLLVRTPLGRPAEPAAP
ncbi:hypothetical protein O7627_26805 [Solwaraspora sp. WMMD1047]|uniref:hypothetical protein n=1 Tax=Solwaraspora sp. WMMD1047 TaxID=3016102 RepID=UPI0024169D29|nr:hypothetical protein [Solwaraspora sp. WMMD1047]MDG4832889.1 hypothetical protein [Solwaraspora sp. WMMD1047]